MATNFNTFNLDLFKIGKTQQTGATQGTGKVNEKNPKDIDIAGAAGWNNFAENAIGDTFTRTTQNNETTGVEGTAKGEKVAQDKKANAQKDSKMTKPAMGMNKNQNASNANKFGSASGFGMLSLNNNEDKTDKTESNSGFGSLSLDSTPSNTNAQNEELQELAEALDCEANEDIVKEKLEGMDAKDLAKLDGEMLDIAEDLGLIEAKDIEKKTGVTEKELTSDKTKKTNDRKIKFGTMTSGDMV